MKGARYLSTERTYGAGYCGICGDRGPSLVSRLVRWWDCDDGWRLGVLCSGCFGDAEKRPPRPTDYAYRGQGAKRQRIDTIVSVYGDDVDGAIADIDDGI